MAVVIKCLNGLLLLLGLVALCAIVCILIKHRAYNLVTGYFHWNAFWPFSLILFDRPYAGDVNLHWILVISFLDGAIMWFYAFFHQNAYFMVSEFPNSDNADFIQILAIFYFFSNSFFFIFATIEVGLPSMSLFLLDWWNSDGLAMYVGVPFPSPKFFFLYSFDMWMHDIILIYEHFDHLLSFVISCFVEGVIVALEFLLPVNYLSWEDTYFSHFCTFIRNFTQLFVFKFLVVISFVVIIRSGTPRYRFDYLTKLGWLKFLGFTLTILILVVVLYYIW